MNIQMTPTSSGPGNGLAISAIIVSLLCGLVGLILAIIGLNRYPSGSGGKTMCIIALILAILNMTTGLYFGIGKS